MPRPPDDLTTIDPEPSDASLTPTAVSSRELPAVPMPESRRDAPRPRTPTGAERLAQATPPPAEPGERTETPSEVQLTGKIERLPRTDPTPPKLPPSPGARDAERWFEQVPTNPAHIADL